MKIYRGEIPANIVISGNSYQGAHIHTHTDFEIPRKHETRTLIPNPIFEIKLESDRIKLLNMGMEIISNGYPTIKNLRTYLETLTNVFSCDNIEIINGVPNTQFTFGKLVGNKTGLTLIPLNSTMYQQLINPLKTVKFKDLEQGKVYYTPTGEKRIYIGKFNTLFSPYRYNNHESAKVIKNIHLFYKDEKLKKLELIKSTKLYDSNEFIDISSFNLQDVKNSASKGGYNYYDKYSAYDSLAYYHLTTDSTVTLDPIYKAKFKFL